MILFFGPTGSGKSMQGQLMAARHGWRWISTGQLLRDISDPETMAILSEGKLVSDDYINRLVFRHIDKALNLDGLDHIILDGYPRRIEQAEELLKYGAKVSALVVLRVDSDEIYNRLHLRGRMEDSPEIIKKRIEQYNFETEPIIDFLKKNGVIVKVVDGIGTVGEVHDRIDVALSEAKLEREE
ncbi:MAG: nucleoside monophosphate kinase [Candidatus Nomurabacteria bacterium]|jgi:adenylate kinase|nr:nucleoside monophosphate kinase [Candidatus Nomurabacteria bacterium]